MQPDVEQKLVERAVQESGIQYDTRMDARCRRTGGAGEQVLLGDTRVEDAVGKSLREFSRPVGRRIAAVIATTSGRSPAMRAISSSNTSVQLGSF